LDVLLEVLDSQLHHLAAGQYKQLIVAALDSLVDVAESKDGGVGGDGSGAGGVDGAGVELVLEDVVGWIDVYGVVGKLVD
jgi:hypothetical protein